MNILCAFGRHNYGNPERGHGYEYANFLPALVALGHRVSFFELWDRSAHADFADLNRSFLREIGMHKPEVVLCVTMSGELWSETLELARAGSDAVFIHWNPDDSWKYEQSSRLLSPFFDIMVTTYPGVIDAAARDDLNNFELSQWAANSAAFAEPLAAADCRYDVSFVGSSYGNRTGRVAELAARGVDVECFGYGWPNGPVAAEDIPRIMRESRISLNFGDSGVVLKDGRPTRSRQIKARVFEVPGAGGLLFTEPAEHLEDCFLPGKEIGVFEDIDSLAEQIRSLLDDPVRRDAMAAAGHARCVAEHSYEERFSRLLARAGKLRADRTPPASGIDMHAFETVARRHRVGPGLRLLRALLLLPCRLVWGRQRGARAARRMLFELAWRLVGRRVYRAGGWPGRLFYHES